MMMQGYKNSYDCQVDEVRVAVTSLQIVENRYLVGMNIDEGGRPVLKAGS